MVDGPGISGAPAPDHGVYGISVAAELSGVAVQSLRLYERYGLLTPARSEGGTRRYSAGRRSATAAGVRAWLIRFRRSSDRT